MTGGPRISPELQERILDFARRMCFKGYESLTDARRKKLWEDAEWFLRDCIQEGATGWEAEPVYPCDCFHERFEDEYVPRTARWNRKYCDEGEDPKYFGMLRFICRAAFDIAEDFRGMCWGFTVGDFKHMYDGELPDWFPREGWQDFDGNPVAVTDDMKVAI